MTGSDGGSSGADGGDGDEAAGADEDLDGLQPVSTTLRSAQHRGSDEDAAGYDREDSEQSGPDVPDPDGLNEIQPVSSELRSAQSQAGAGDAGMADDAGEGDDVDASDTGGSDDD